MSSADRPALEVERLSAGYSEIPVVDQVSLEVTRGQVVAVVGPNGAGKSTLLKAILGVSRLLGGRVRLLGQDVTGMPLARLARLGIGYVPQSDDVFDGLRVSENLEMGGYLFPKHVREERVERALQVFPQLRTKIHRYVDTLSGGERKMTAIARVLMLDPHVLLLDEPTASLSAELSRVVLEEQVRALAHLDKAVLVVEQKAVMVLGVADWACLLVRGKVSRSAPGRAVLDDPDMRRLFLGGAEHHSHLQPQ
ncbi:MAG: ATP-binding cassette domain-containing protein [Acidimicrobiaceae bacterium]|nr:ATP-binding cassette domain-containing protein [Acidimicrobiaceae bacterium]